MKTLLKISILLGLTITLSLCENKTFSTCFDCINQKKLSETEKLICSDEELSKLDNEMAKAYKYMLSISNETQKQQLIDEQRKWLRYRDRMAIESISNTTPMELRGTSYISYWQPVSDVYASRLFYLRPDGFHLIYAKDNSTCNTFIDILKNDLEKNGDIKLTRINEFNWVDWKDINYKRYGVYNTYISYFDINNDGIEEAVFKREGQSRGYELFDMHYTSKGDNSESYRDMYWKQRLHKDEIDSGFGDMCAPDQYPFKLNNTYYIAVFGAQKIYIMFGGIFSLYSMPNNGDRIDLIKFNNENKIDTICIIDRIDNNIKKHLEYLR
ncbi:MAG: lysozyme inhibitor LprI family protein [Campylobacteraceae bacterium]|jgi:uncharacterized protein YecT (DUF1311 family)|nr:lysozyme inhibitor LprI family protein [Campylobacteraceae bacterium]